MQLSETSVRRPILITMFYVVVLAVCAMFISNLQLSLYPDVDMPMMAVYVRLSDADPETAEQQVAKVLENYTGSVENLNKITTQSTDDAVVALLEFNYGTNLDDAEEDLNSVVNQINGQDLLPDWAESITVYRFDKMANSSFMTLVMSGSSDLDELKSIADNDVSPLLQRVEGVSQVEVSGTGDLEYDVSVDPIKLSSYNLALSQVTTALAARNVQESLGTITQDKRNYTIRIDRRFGDIDDIKNTKITTLNGVDIHVGDVATVVTSHGDSYTAQYLDGKQVVVLSVANESGTSSVTVAKALKAALPGINEQLPDGVTVSIQRDQTKMISQTMQEVYSSAIEGILLAALAIFIFLRNIKATVIISLSMPISIMVTLMVMSMADITVNSMSMAGLILGIGMIVDASVLNLENTYNFRRQGRSAVASAILGSRDMATANLGSTLTTICVFLPLIIYKNKLEMIGIMFQDLIWTVVISLVVSLIVAQTLVPALCGSILRLDSRTQKPLKNKLLKNIDDGCERFQKKLEDWYVGSLAYCLKHRFLMIMTALLLVIYCTMQLGGVGLSLMPSMKTDDSVEMELTMQSGTTQSVVQENLFAMQEDIMKTLPQDAYTQIMVKVGTDSTGTITISLPDVTEQTYSADKVKDMLRPLTTRHPDETWTFSAGRGPGNNNPIEIKVSGSDISAITEGVNQIAAILRTYVPEAVDVSTDLENGSPRVSLDIDMDRAETMGVTMSDIASTVYTALSGTTATTISTFSSDTTYDLNVQIGDVDLTSIEDLGNLLVTGDSGAVRLDSFTSFSVSNGPATITRENKKRVNTVTAQLADGYSAGQVQTLVNEALDKYFSTPEGVTVTQSGDMQQFADYGPALVVIILVALLLVFAVMAGQFESLINPFIIFATIPLMMIGVVLIHIWMHQSFSLFSLVGIVALIGVVVNNGIVLVDTLNHMVREHIPVMEACLKAARLRLRPILMTTLTTVVGMVPLAFFPGEGSEMMQPIALTFVGGLVTGGFLTLYYSPILYSLFNARLEKKFDDPSTLSNQIAQFDKEEAEEKLKKALSYGKQTD